jgi:hypothetical protein
MAHDSSLLTPGRLRWWGLAGGVLWAIADTLLAAALGFTFEVGGRDATWLVAAFFGSSFAVLGFLVGYAVDARLGQPCRSGAAARHRPDDALSVDEASRCLGCTALTRHRPVDIPQRPSP